jgi:hypothetical protein
MSKKGQADWSDFVLMILAFVLVMLFMGMFFGNIEKERERLANKAIAQFTVERDLLTLLESPVSVEGKDVQLADLIVMWHLNERAYRDVLIRETHEVLRGFPGLCMAFRPDVQSSLVIEPASPMVHERPGACGIAKKYMAEATLPTPDGKVTVRFARATG